MTTDALTPKTLLPMTTINDRIRALKVTKAETALLLAFVPYLKIEPAMHYDEGHYHLYLTTIESCARFRTQREQKALARLVERGILARTTFGYHSLAPDFYPVLTGMTFEACARFWLRNEAIEVATQRHYAQERINEAINDTTAPYTLQAIWKRYTEYTPEYQLKVGADPINVARWQHWMSGGMRALAFHHFVTDAFDNYERALQSVDHWLAEFDLYGARRVLASLFNPSFFD